MPHCPCLDYKWGGGRGTPAVSGTAVGWEVRRGAALFERRQREDSLSRQLE